MLVDVGGRVLKIIERGRCGSVDTALLTADKPSALDELWPADCADAVIRLIRRTVRERRTFAECLGVGTDQELTECLCVPQGRDKALVVMRPRSMLADQLLLQQGAAHQDPVTGLPDRVRLTQALQRIIELQALREGRAAVLSLHTGDITHCGQPLTGEQLDDALCEVAGRLLAQIRGSNEPFEPDMERVTVVARSDYREFTVVLPAIEAGEDAEAVASRIIASLDAGLTLSERAVWLAPRVGIALFPQDGDNAAALIAASRVAMADAMSTGDACFRMHSGTLRMRALQRQDLTCELRAALARDEFRLHFLPIVDAKSGSAQTLEALLRWPDSLLEAGSVDKIVAAAERTGLIVDIGEWVLRTGLRELARWRRAGHQQLRLAINLSAQEFARNDLTDCLGEALRQADVDGAALDIEINEQVLMRDAQAGFRRLNALKSLGVRIVIDDFGSGHASLRCLAESGADGLKINRTLVASLLADDAGRAACLAALAATKALGIAATAAGVEAEEQAVILRQQGCHSMQGFLFSRPLPAEAVMDYLSITGRYRTDDVAGG